MAQNLQLLLRRKKTAQNIAQIARAMEMISASKIKKAQEEVLNNKPYAQKITELTGSIIKNTDLSAFSHPYVGNNTSQKNLILVISPDKGLCGSLNTNLFKKLLAIDNKYLKIIALGKKVSRFARRLEGELIAELPIGTRLPPYTIVYQLIEIINQEIMNDHVSSFKILFTEFKSLFTQEPTVRNVLPIETPQPPPAVSPPAGGSRPGSFAPQTGSPPKGWGGKTGAQSAPYLFEPSLQDLLRALLPYYLEVLLYNSIIEAFTSEQAARMVAMQNAKNNALDIADYLTLIYNKSRQERITNELLTLSNSL